MQWDDVRYFLVLAREGSLSAAARRLAVEHSTVARRADALEQAVGVRLFDRLPRGWRLTDEGRALAERAARMEHEAASFARAAAGAGSLRGTVRLSAPPTIASHFIAPHLAALRRQWPGIDLVLLGETRNANLMAHEADLAIRLSRPTASNLATRPLGDLGYGLYAMPEVLARPEAEWEFIGYDERLRHVPQQRWLDDYAGERRVVLRCSDLSAIHQAALAGLGVAALPHFLGAPAETGTLLRRLPVDDPALHREIWLVIHPDVRRSPRVRAVANGLIALFEANRHILAGQ
ncbi:LysR family transcriptional regulator [uncultured Ralstonia sp.]|uniref:LysR family transcriptional regulator n=1 Tax=Ralstonia sp. TaxID=54061 RepID=UPI001EABE4CF|nr:LysR family transcriptional regulator [uncultured Ralstonia sp.]UCF23048.1 MAG: LysR family transcriptional regulator [Ralstonia sp.]